MRRLVAPALACLVLAVGCGGEDEAAPADTQIDPVEETATGQPLLPRSVVVGLDPAAGSQVQGAATLSPVQGRSATRFVVDVAEGAADQAAIVAGSCAAPGDDVAVLPGGAGSTVIDVAMQPLLDGEEQLAVVLRAGGEVVACGNVEEATEE